jgi:hypothetical protein
LKSFFLMWHHWASSCCTTRQSARNAKLNALRVLDMNLLRQNFMQMQNMFQRWTQFNSESKSNRDRSTIQVLHCIHTEANKDENIQTKNAPIRCVFFAFSPVKIYKRSRL